MKYFRNLKIILPVIFILVIGAIASIYYFGIQIGTDYDPGIMVTMHLNGNDSKKEVDSLLKSNFDDYERVDQVGNEYNIYFINSESNITSKDAKSAIQTSLSELFKDHGEISVSDYTPSKLAYINVRFRDTALFLTSIFAIFTLILYKKNNLRRDEILALLVTDFILMLLVITILIGGIAVCGEFNIFVNRELVTSLFFIMALVLSVKIFADLRFDDFLESHKNVSIDLTWDKYVDRDWPIITFVLILLIILVVTPMSVLGINYMVITIILSLALVVAYIAEIALKQTVLKLLLAGINKTPGLKLLHQKKW